MPKYNHRRPSRSFTRLSPKSYAEENFIDLADRGDETARGSSTMPSRRKSCHARSLSLVQHRDGPSFRLEPRHARYGGCAEGGWRRPSPHEDSRTGRENPRRRRGVLTDATTTGRGAPRRGWHWPPPHGDARSRSRS